MTFRLRLFVADEYKPLRLVHWSLWLLTLGAFLAQVAFHLLLVPPPQARAVELQQPPSLAAWRLGAFGEPATFARLLVLRLQAFDNQSGISISFKEIDYGDLGDWLDQIVELDGRAEYPHFLMSKIYSAVFEKERQLQAAIWTRRHFLDDPDARWEWMAHVTNLAKHVLEEDALALEMARELRENTTPGKVPNWARQMEAFFLENQNEFEAAATILENQLLAGEIREPQEFLFLSYRLETILRSMYERGEIEESEVIKKVEVIEKLQSQFVDQFDVEEK